jgi:membrane glycosyltransferase
LIAPSLVAWMSPTIAGLLLAAVLSWGSGQLAAGLALRNVGLLQTPEEHARLTIVTSADDWREALDEAVDRNADGLYALHTDRELRELHTRFLPPPAERPRGDVDVGNAIASAKLDEALSIDDALSWLNPAERTAVLLDRKLINRLAALQPSASGREAAK